MRSLTASRAVRNSTGAFTPRLRIASHTSRPSLSGRPMSSTIASGTSCSSARRVSPPVARPVTSKPSRTSARPTISRRSASSSTRRMRCCTHYKLLLSEDGPQRQAAQPARREPCGGEGREDRRATEPREEAPRDRERVRRWVEDVLEHRHEHLRERPAEPCGEYESRAEHEDRLRPHERPDVPERRAERGHGGELLLALRDAERDEQTH